MNLTDFHHTCMDGGKIYNSSRILHALLKKSCKTGGCLLKISDQDHRIGWVGGWCFLLSEPSKNPKYPRYTVQLYENRPTDQTVGHACDLTCNSDLL